MADSDNSMTLPFVTRRQVLAGGMITSTALVHEECLGGGNAAATNIPPDPDPALTLWREWEAAHKLTERLCHRQQRLESRLVQSVGFPCAIVRLREGEDVTVHSIHALNEVLGKGPDMAALRKAAEADFVAHRARWDAAAEEAGYTAALGAEREAGDRAADLLEAFSTTPATTLAGVASKLDAVLREGQAWEECSEFPWPQVRSALSDLVRIAQQMMPDRSFTASSIPSSARGRQAAVSAPEDKKEARYEDQSNPTSGFSRDPVNLQRSVFLTLPFNRQQVGDTGRSCDISKSGGGRSRSAGRLQS